MVKAIRRSGAQEISDERILGSSDFVDQVIRESEEKRKYQFPDGSLLEKSKKLIVGECNKEKISLQALKAGSRQRDISKVRLRLAKILVNEYGLSKAETARLLGVSASAIANAIRRDQSKK